MLSDEELDKIQSNYDEGYYDKLAMWAEISRKDTTKLLMEVRRLRSRLEAADRLADASMEIASCPYILEEASIPKAGIQANPDQVVGMISCAMVRLDKLEKSIEAYHKAKEGSDGN